MGIPFITMDAHNIVNNIVNDAVGIPPAAPEPTGPIDITDQCTIASAGAWGSGGNIDIRIEGLEYLDHYFEVITKWPSSTSATSFDHWNVTDASDSYNSDTKELTTKCYYPTPSKNPGTGLDIGIMISSGNLGSSNPIVVSVKVSETEF